MAFITQKKLIGGHRGSPKKQKENTILSFVQAIEDGADFIEFDVRRARDGNLVIHHDAEISGIALRTLKLSEINEIAIEKEYEVPVLEDVLIHCVNRIMLDVEIKEPEITLKTATEVLKYFSVDKFIITSFYDETLAVLNSDHPEIKKGLLFDKNSDHDLEERISSLKPDFLLPHHSIFDEKIKEICRKFSLSVILWTVNNEADMIKFINDKLVTGIISDHPEVANKIQKV